MSLGTKCVISDWWKHKHLEMGQKNEGWKGWSRSCPWPAALTLTWRKTKRRRNSFKIKQKAKWVTRCHCWFSMYTANQIFLMRFAVFHLGWLVVVQFLQYISASFWTTFNTNSVCPQMTMEEYNMLQEGEDNEDFRMQRIDERQALGTGLWAGQGGQEHSSAAVEYCECSILNRHYTLKRCSLTVCVGFRSFLCKCSQRWSILAHKRYTHQK